jgi:hypothetical protein
MALDTHTFVALFATIVVALGIFNWLKFRAANKNNP